MGMSGQIIAIGAFSRKLVEHLPYDASLFDKTTEGARIAIDVFGMMPGSSSSRSLAECFGVNPWKFDEHKLDLSKLDMDRLLRLVDERLVTNKQVSRFNALANHGFVFYFMPNG